MADLGRAGGWHAGVGLTAPAYALAMAMTEPASADRHPRSPVPAGLRPRPSPVGPAAGAGRPGPRHGPVPVPAGVGLDPEPIRRRLAAIAHGVEPFEVAFRRVASLPEGRLPRCPSRRRRSRGADRGRRRRAIPDYPPYGGDLRRGRPAPDGDRVRRRRHSTRSRPRPSGRCRSRARVGRARGARRDRTEGRWRRHWRMPLGVRP